MLEMFPPYGSWKYNKIKKKNNILFANFRQHGLHQTKSSMTQYKVHDIHLSLTKASALFNYFFLNQLPRPMSLRLRMAIYKSCILVFVLNRLPFLLIVFTFTTGYNPTLDFCPQVSICFSLIECFILDYLSALFLLDTGKKCPPQTGICQGSFIVDIGISSNMVFLSHSSYGMPGLAPLMNVLF